MNYINKTFYINLDHRTDRKENMIREFSKINFSNYERFSAIKNELGALGCGLSHLNILHIFDNNQNLKLGMIIEDDGTFLVSREEIDKYVTEFIKDTDANILCLGFGAYDNKPYNEHFQRSFNLQTTSCYVIKKKFVKILLENMTEACMQLSKCNPTNIWYMMKQYSIDIYWKKLQNNYIFLIPNNRVVKQINSYSDIMKHYVTYDC